MESAGKENAWLKAEGGPCRGINIQNDPESKLQGLSWSLRQWWEAGQPMAVNTTKRVLASTSWFPSEDQILIKHTMCESPRVACEQACLQCQSLVKSSSGVRYGSCLAKEIATWGYCFDLCQLAYLTSYGIKKDQMDQKKLMENRDYIKTGHVDIGCMQKIFQLEPVQLVSTIRRKLESFPKHYPNASYDFIIQSRLAGLCRPLFNTQPAQTRFATTIKKFQSFSLQSQVLEDESRMFF